MISGLLLAGILNKGVGGIHSLGGDRERFGLRVEDLGEWTNCVANFSVVQPESQRCGSCFLV